MGMNFVIIALILNLIIGAVLYVKSRPVLNWQRAMISTLLITLVYGVILYNVSVFIHGDWLIVGLLALWGITFGWVLLSIYEVFKSVLNGSKLIKKEGQIVPVVVIAIAIFAMLVMDRDVTYFTLIVAGITLMLASWLRPGLMVDRANLLSLLYTLPISVLFLFLSEVLSTLRYSPQQYLPFTLLGVRLEHLLLIVTYGVYILAIYQTSRKLNLKKIKLPKIKVRN